MKWLLFSYWMIGCWLLGLVLAADFQRCPQDIHKLATSDFLTTIMWPAAIVAAIALPKGFKITQRPCGASQ